MPANKLRPQKLQCPFCSAISTRGTGLAAHVRAKHPRAYGKWNKNPNRMLEADAAASPQHEVRKNRRLHPGEKLALKLKTLAGRGIIEARLVDWAHGIRLVGNEAAHDTETEVSKEDARDALDFTEALLTYVFVLNERFAAFSQRRASRTQER